MVPERWEANRCKRHSAFFVFLGLAASELRIWGQPLAGQPLAPPTPQDSPSPNGSPASPPSPNGRPSQPPQPQLAAPGRELCMAGEGGGSARLAYGGGGVIGNEPEIAKSVILNRLRER